MGERVFIPHDHCETAYLGDCFAEGKCLRYGSKCKRYWAETTTVEIGCTRGEEKSIREIIQRSGFESGDLMLRALRAWERAHSEDDL